MLYSTVLDKSAGVKLGSCSAAAVRHTMHNAHAHPPMHVHIGLNLQKHVILLPPPPPPRFSTFSKEEPAVIVTTVPIVTYKYARTSCSNV
jgi:hypothetical protein